MTQETNKTDYFLKINVGGQENLTLSILRQTNPLLNKSS